MQRCILALLFCISFSGCTSEAERERERERDGRQAAANPPISGGAIRLTGDQILENNIQTTAAIEDEIAPSISAPGRIKARAGGNSHVYAPFAGRLIVNTSQLPRVGADVQAGQLLAEVEQVFAASERLQLRATEVQLQTEIDQTRQEVELRQKELDRARQLYEGGAIPQRQLQEAEFNLKQAQAKLQGAERTKTEYDEISAQQSSQRRTPIRAPISGTVIALDLANGQQVDSAKSLLTILDTSIVWAELAIQETDLAKFRRVTAAEISAPSNPGRIHAGRLESIGSSVDPQNRTVPVIFSVNNTDRTLKLEMYVDGRVRSGSPQKTIIAPASAVLSEEGISSVFVETESGVFRRRAVTLGARQGGGIAIAAGLNAGEKVVSTGAQSLNSEALKSLIPAEEGEKR